MTLILEAILVSRLDYCGPKLDIFRTRKFLERLTKALILQVELMAIHGSAIFGSVIFFCKITREFFGYALKFNKSIGYPSFL